MNHFFAKMSARVRCSWCNQRVLVVSGEEIDCDENALEDIGIQIEQAITDQQEDDGWLGSYCPDCRDTHHKEIAALERADDYSMEDDR